MPDRYTRAQSVNFKDELRRLGFRLRTEEWRSDLYPAVWDTSSVEAVVEDFRDRPDVLRVIVAALENGATEFALSIDHDESDAVNLTIKWPSAKCKHAKIVSGECVACKQQFHEGPGQDR